MEDKKLFAKYIKNLHGKTPMLLLLGAGVLLLLFSSQFSSGGGKAAAGDAALDTEKYVAQLEARLGEMCASVDGAGRCRVMITLEGGEYYVYAADKSSSGALDYVVSSGSGLLLETKLPSVRGVAVVCEGGARDRVREEMTRLICAALGVPSSRVFITSGVP